MSNLAVLIPAYNERKGLVKILKYKKKFNFFVIDDCSSDGTLDLLKKKKNKIYKKPKATRV